MKYTKEQLSLIPGVENVPIPAGYEVIFPGETIVEGSYYNPKSTATKDIKDWYSGAMCYGQIRIKESIYIFIRPAAPANKYNYTLITDFKVGDIFARKGLNPSLLITCHGWVSPFAAPDRRYSIAGYDGLMTYSNCQGILKDEMLNHLNKYQFIFITNINKYIENSLDLAAKLVNNG